MAKYVIKRFLMMILVLFGVLFVVFSINYISPVDPVDVIVGADAAPEIKEMKRQELGLDQPYWAQLGNYIKQVLTGSLGTSWNTKTDVMNDILTRFPTTLKMSIMAIALATAVGIPLGIISAVKQNSLLDYICTFLALIGASMPSFWLGLMLIIGFSLNLGWLPATGVATWQGYILPVIAIGIYPIATITRTTRASMLEVIRQDYIRTARAKGMMEKKIITKHALKNALIPVITIVGMQLGFVLGGVMVIEAVFNISGVGSLLKMAIGAKDNPTITGCVLFSSFAMCTVNLLVDILYAFIDPRIKAQYAKSGKKRGKPAGQGGQLHA
ncbi:MAG: ABC transporter permease [Oscillospiraceae bacterium]|nr:ABC transporter permease [Oscillospiraceae bacterium]